MRADTIFTDLKLLKHMDFLNAVLNGDLPPPLTAEIDLTNKCNHDCIWCIDAKIREGGESLKKEVVLETLISLRKLGCKNIVFKGGGEPMVHPDILEIIQQAGQYHAFKLGIVTNGTMNEDLAAAIAEYATFARVSIDAATAKTHRKIHQATNFDSIIENLVRLTEYRKGPYPTIGINFVIWRQNASEIFEAARLYKRIGVDYVHFKMAIMPGDELEDHIRTEIQRAGRKARKLQTQTFIVNTKEIEGYYLHRRGKPMESSNSWKHCIAPHIAPIITADGNVFPCCYSKECEKYVAGNINMLSFEKIHTSKRRKKVLERIDSGACRVFCRGKTSNMRYDYVNRIINYLKLRKTADEGFM